MTLSKKNFNILAGIVSRNYTELLEQEIISFCHAEAWSFAVQ